MFKKSTATLPAAILIFGSLFQALFRYLVALIGTVELYCYHGRAEEARVGAAPAALPVAEDLGYCSGELWL